MFSGIVEETAKVVKIEKEQENLHITMECSFTAELKIDQSFIANLEKDSSDQAMIVTILNMAKIFNLKVVAEGVETAEQLSFLHENNCHIFQGYYFSKPLIDDDFENFYKANIV